MHSDCCHVAKTLPSIHSDRCTHMYTDVQMYPDQTQQPTMCTLGPYHHTPHPDHDQPPSCLESPYEISLQSICCSLLALRSTNAGLYTTRPGSPAAAWSCCSAACCCCCAACCGTGHAPLKICIILSKPGLHSTGQHSSGCSCGHESVQSTQAQQSTPPCTMDTGASQTASVKGPTVDCTAPMHIDGLVATLLDR